MNRRAFLKTSGASAAGIVVTGCLPRLAAAPAGGPTGVPQRIELVPVNVAWDRIIRTTVGLRPHRDSGFVVRAEQLDDKVLVHNYGHGGAGWSLGWGTGLLATELALVSADRRAAVIGCGAVGLMTARQLQRHGFDVTIYAAALPPETTSNMSWAAFTPASGLITADRRTPAWDAQFRRAAEISYREHQSLAGRDYGVSWIYEYSVSTGPRLQGDATGATAVFHENTGPDLLPPDLTLGHTPLAPGTHPFPAPYASRMPSLRFEPSIYLDALMRDVMLFGGRIVVRRFDTPRDLAGLPERVVVNCTGLGSKALFGDEELTPVKGQLVVLVPQPDVNYTVAGMMPRRDGIVLGHVVQRGVWSMDVDEAERTKVMERAIAFFGGMHRPTSLVSSAGIIDESSPPVEAFFDRES